MSRNCIPSHRWIDRWIDRYFYFFHYCWGPWGSGLRMAALNYDSVQSGTSAFDLNKRLVEENELWSFVLLYVWCCYFILQLHFTFQPCKTEAFGKAQFYLNCLFRKTGVNGPFSFEIGFSDLNPCHHPCNILLWCLYARCFYLGTRTLLGAESWTTPWKQLWTQ